MSHLATIGAGICPNDGELLAKHPQCSRCSMWMCPGESLGPVCKDCRAEQTEDIKYTAALIKRRQKNARDRDRDRRRRSGSWAA